MTDKDNKNDPANELEGFFDEEDETSQIPFKKNPTPTRIIVKENEEIAPDMFFRKSGNTSDQWLITDVRKQLEEEGHSPEGEKALDFIFKDSNDTSDQWLMSDVKKALLESETCKKTHSEQDEPETTTEDTYIHFDELQEQFPENNLTATLHEDLDALAEKFPHSSPIRRTGRAGKLVLVSLIAFIILGSIGIPVYYFGVYQTTSSPTDSLIALNLQTEEAPVYKNETPLHKTSSHIEDSANFTTDTGSDLPSYQELNQKMPSHFHKQAPEPVVARLPEKDPFVEEIKSHEPAPLKEEKEIAEAVKPVIKKVTVEKIKVDFSGWYVQLAAYGSMKEAITMKDQLTLHKIPVDIQKISVKDKEFFRVLAGPQSNKTQAGKLLKSLRSYSFISKDAFLKKL